MSVQNLLSRLRSRAGFSTPSLGQVEQALSPSGSDEISQESTLAPSIVNSLAQELSEQHEDAIVQQTNNPMTWLGGAETYDLLERVTTAPELFNARERAFFEPLANPVDETPEVVEPPPGQGWREGGVMTGAGVAPTRGPINPTAAQYYVRTQTVTGNALGWHDEVVAIPPGPPPMYIGADIAGAPTPATAAPVASGCIPFDHSAIQHIRNIVPAVIHEMLWVAGSACCTYPLNEDVDVWLGWLSEESTTTQRRHWLTVSQYEGNTARDLPESEIYPGQQSVLLYAGVAPDGTRIHILGALAPMLDVIGNFDISCHARGVRLSDGFVRDHPMFTSPAQVNILNWTNSKKTLIRGIRFSERYGDIQFWQCHSSKRCAAEAFNMPYVTDEMAERVQALSVSEGL